MAKLRTSKYIVTDVTPDRIFAGAPAGQNKIPDGVRVPPTHVMWLDGTVVPGAFYVECVWVWPQTASEEVVAPAHSHDFPEVVAFFGTDFNHPHDLCGEVELWLDGEKHILTQSFLAFIPAGMTHCPLITRRADRPLFHFSIGLGGEYKR